MRTIAMMTVALLGVSAVAHAYAMLGGLLDAAQGNNPTIYKRGVRAIRGLAHSILKEGLVWSERQCVHCRAGQERRRLAANPCLM